MKEDEKTKFSLITQAEENDDDNDSTSEGSDDSSEEDDSDDTQNANEQVSDVVYVFNNVSN